MSTPMLDAELARFGDDLVAAAATPALRRRRARRLTIAVAVGLALLVPGAIAAVDSLFLTADRPMIEPPPGFTVPKVVGPAVRIASGDLRAGTWSAYAVRCGGRASIVVVSPNGSRTSAACGAVPPGGRRPAPVFAPSTFYDGDVQTTFIYAAVPFSVARVRLDLAGHAQSGTVRLPGAGPSRHELVPTSIPDAVSKLRLNVKFVVLAVPGEQDVKQAVALDAQGKVLARR